MQEIFEKIINKLEKQKEYYKDIRKNTRCRVTETSECDSCRADHFLDARLRCVDDIIKIVKQEAKQYNNGWIPCSERLPEKRDWYLAVFEEVDTGFIGIPYIADYLMGSHTKFTTEDGWIISNCSDREDESAEYYKNLRCVAWQPLPQTYQPKGDNDENTN